jgi:hypothetical protein
MLHGKNGASKTLVLRQFPPAKRGVTRGEKSVGKLYQTCLGKGDGGGIAVGEVSFPPRAART